jgi:protoporphyrinogen oxidase
MSKYYRWDLKTLAAEMDKGSIPIPDRARVVAGFKGEQFSSAGYNPVIYYPLPSLSDFIERYADRIRDRINLNEEVVAIDTDRRTVRTRCAVYAYEKLVTSMPLKQLLRIIQPQGRFPSHYQLQHVSTLLVNVVLTRKRKRLHWVYLAEKKFPFYRVGLYAAHPHPVAYLEKNILPGAASHAIDREQLRQETAFTLKELKMIEHDDEIVHLDARVIPFSYVIFDKSWKKTVPPLLEQLKKHDIYSIGRYGTWNYTYMSHDIQAARRVARSIAYGGPSGSRFLKKSSAKTSA